MGLVASAAPSGVTRATLRRTLCRARGIREPFHMSIPDGYLAVASGSTTTSVKVTTGVAGLWTEDDWWKRSTLYCIYANGTTVERRVTAYDSDGATFTVAPPLPIAPTADVDVIELHSRSLATDKNDVLNAAIGSGYPQFFTQQIWEVVIPEGAARLTSDHGLPTDWHTLNSVWLEPALEQNGPYLSTSVTTTTIADGTQNWTTDQWAGYTVAIVRGGGAGQLATVTTNDSTTLTFTPAIPDLVGTHLPRFVLKKAETFAPTSGHEASTAWVPIADVMPVGSPYFRELMLPDWLQRMEGRTLLLGGTLQPTSTALTTDASTTIVPMDYIINQAAATLLLSLTVTPGSSSDGIQFLGRWYAQEAERYRKQVAWQHPLGTKWRQPTKDTSTSRSAYDGNPLNW